MIMMKMAQHGVTEIIHMKRYTCISLVAFLIHRRTKHCNLTENQNCMLRVLEIEEQFFLKIWLRSRFMLSGKLGALND